MIQGFRPISNKSESGLVQVAANIWTIEAKKCVCYRPSMQPRYSHTHCGITYTNVNHCDFGTAVHKPKLSEQSFLAQLAHYNHNITLPLRQPTLEQAEGTMTIAQHSFESA